MKKLLFFLIFGVVIYMFFSNKDNSPTLEVKMRNSAENSSNEKYASFTIPRGYLTKGANEPTEEAISLTVGYKKNDAPIPIAGFSKENAIFIRIKTHNMETQGDRTKKTIDADLGRSSINYVVEKKSDSEYLINNRDKSKDPSEFYLYYDKARAHWVELHPSTNLLPKGEGIVKNQKVAVYYRYSEKINSDPFEIYEWVMSLVESLQK